MKSKNNNEEIVLEGEFEEVLEVNGHFFLRNKKDLICVLPYTIGQDGLLDKMGIIEVENQELKSQTKSLLTDYLSADDPTNLVGANRILYNISGVNLTDATKWMYLGTVTDSLNSVSNIRIYGVDISDIEIQQDVMNEEQKDKFKMIDASTVLQSDDLLFLGAFTRLFNFFYVSSLK